MADAHFIMENDATVVLIHCLYFQTDLGGSCEESEKRGFLKSSWCTKLWAVAPRPPGPSELKMTTAAALHLRMNDSQNLQLILF